MTLAKERVDEKKQELLKKAGAGSHAQADVHRQIRLWSLRLQLYCRMKENFHHTGQSAVRRGRSASRGRSLSFFFFNCFSIVRKNRVRTGFFFFKLEPYHLFCYVGICATRYIILTRTHFSCFNEKCDKSQKIFGWYFNTAHFVSCMFEIFDPELPVPPCQVSIVVTSTSSLFVAIKELEGDRVGLITCYKGK